MLITVPPWVVPLFVIDLVSQELFIVPEDLPSKGLAIDLKIGIS